MMLSLILALVLGGEPRVVRIEIVVRVEQATVVPNDKGIRSGHGSGNPFLKMTPEEKASLERLGSAWYETPEGTAFLIGALLPNIEFDGDRLLEEMRRDDKQRLMSDDSEEGRQYRAKVQQQLDKMPAWNRKPTVDELQDNVDRLEKELKELRRERDDDDIGFFGPS